MNKHPISYDTYHVVASHEEAKTGNAYIFDKAEYKTVPIMHAVLLNSEVYGQIRNVHGKLEWGVFPLENVAWFAEEKKNWLC